MDLEGNLTVFEPAAVFQMLNIAQASGELLLDQGHNSARVYFDGGDVTYAEISHRPVRLGEWLVSHGVITQKQLDRVLVRDRRNRRIGDLLIEDGVLDEDTLHQALEEQVKEVIYEVVRWKKGWFRFHSGRRPRPGEITIHIPLDHLMLEGLRRLDEESSG